MRRGAVRAAAALATLAVFVAGAFWFRELFVEPLGDFANWPRSVSTIEVDAADGVRVDVEQLDDRAEDSAADAQWRTDSVLGRAEVAATESGRVIARCHTPTLLSRCTIWLTVRATARAARVVIVQRPGAVVVAVDPRVEVEVRQAP